MPHQVPAELQRLSLYALDEKLCLRWAEVLPVWKETYKGIDILYEVQKAHTWEICKPEERKTNRVAFLNGWLSRAHGDWHRHQQERGLKFVGRHIPDSKKPISCKRCLDNGVVPATMKSRWGEDLPAMARCPDCAFKKALMG